MLSGSLAGGCLARAPGMLPVGDRHVLVTFLIYLTKYLTKTTYRKVCFASHFEDTVHREGEGIIAGGCCHCGSRGRVRKATEMIHAAQMAFVFHPILLSWSPAHRIVLPTFRISLPCSVNLYGDILTDMPKSVSPR